MQTSVQMKIKYFKFTEIINDLFGEHVYTKKASNGIRMHLYTAYK